MAAYRADIEIGVKGIRQLQAITKQIETLSTGVDSVNKRLANSTQSINAYNANLAKAAATLSKVNAGTIAEADAIRQYVQALGQANTARDRQNRLIQEQIALQRKAVATRDAGFGVQGPRQAPVTTSAGQRNGGRPGRFSNVVLGAGFPLLFGGGPGSVLGGAAGGLVGGPGAFAAQIGLSALGQQLDTLVAAAARASTAFTSTAKAFDFVQEKALFSSESARELAIELEEQGKVTELSALLSKELSEILGNQGVKAMKDLGQTTNKTTELWNKLTLQLQALIAGPLNAFLTWVNNAISTLSARLRFGALQRDLAGNEELAAEIQRRRKARGRGARLGALTGQDYTELISQFGGLVQPTEQIPITAEDLRTITAPKTAAGRRGPADRTAQLKEDLEAMKLISITQDGIRDALFEGNKELAIRLAYDQKVYDINRDTAKALLNANYETEKAVIRAQEIVRLKDAQLERDDELRELARDINRILTETLDDLRGGVTWDDTGLRDIFDLRLPDAINEFQENIAALQDPTNQIIGAATAIGDAFTSSFRDIVSGAVSAQQGLANFFKNVGDYFIDLSARILAEALKLQAVQIISSIFGSALGSFGTSNLTLPGLEGAGALSSGIASGAAVPNYSSGVVKQLSSSPQLFPGGVFAEGGFVTSPTRALIGEGGEPEYVIPASKMAGAMARYASGLRGGGVIDGAVSDNRNFLDSLTTGINGSTADASEQDAATAGAAATRASLRETERFRENQMQIMNQQTERERRFERERIEQMASTPGNLNIRYESQVINNVEYVTRDQAERLASQSALRGRELAINALQTSVKTRKRVGMA